MMVSSTVPGKSLPALSPNLTVAALAGNVPKSTKVRSTRLVRKECLEYGPTPNFILEILPYAKVKIIIEPGRQFYDDTQEGSVRKPSIFASFLRISFRRRVSQKYRN
jgi:hypothetical protein